MKTQTQWWSHEEKRALAWMGTQIQQLGYQLVGPLVYEKVSSLTCLVKMPTNGGMLYFKANRCLAAHTIQARSVFSPEASLTQTLASLFPASLPPVMAIEPEQQWMLLRDVGSLSLRKLPMLAVWSETIRTFAHLQIASIPLKEELLQKGCVDRQLDYLVQDLRDLLPVQDIWSQLQTPALNVLRQSIPLLHRLCVRLAHAPIPATLVHGDLHADNIVLQQDRPIFLDWSDGCIAHPFFDAITLWARARRLLQEGNVRSTLQEAYLAPWRAYASRAQLAEIVLLAEILGCVHQIVSYRTILRGDGAWKQKMRDGLAYWVYTLLEMLKKMA